MYPSATAVRFTGLLQRGKPLDPTEALPLNSSSSVVTPLALDKGQRKTTAHLHSFLLSLESFFQGTGEEQAESFEDVNIPVYVVHYVWFNTDSFVLSFLPSYLSNLNCHHPFFIHFLFLHFSFLPSAIVFFFLSFVPF